MAKERGVHQNIMEYRPKLFGGHPADVFHRAPCARVAQVSFEREGECESFARI